ncbi:MAG: GlcG/HbpS family heme-binding protein [Acidimicrobiia bacterium]
MAKVTLQQATVIVDRTLAKGREIDCAPLTVAVLDDGGHLVALKREDDSGILRPQIAIGKAWGALGMGFPSRVLAERAQHMPQFYGALSDMSGGKLVPVAGGVLVRSTDGELLGAVGVTGDTSDRDETCAVVGVEAAGLVPDTGQ